MKCNDKESIFNALHMFEEAFLVMNNYHDKKFSSIKNTIE